MSEHPIYTPLYLESDLLKFWESRTIKISFTTDQGEQPAEVHPPGTMDELTRLRARVCELEREYGRLLTAKVRSCEAEQAMENSHEWERRHDALEAENARLKRLSLKPCAENAGYRLLLIDGCEGPFWDVAEWGEESGCWDHWADSADILAVFELPDIDKLLDQ